MGLPIDIPIELSGVRVGMIKREVLHKFLKRVFVAFMMEKR